MNTVQNLARQEIRVTLVPGMFAAAFLGTCGLATFREAERARRGAWLPLNPVLTVLARSGRTAMLVALLSASLTTIGIHAQVSPQPRSTIREVVTVMGMVDRIDQLSRGLTVRTDAGAVYSIHVGPEFTLFAELTRGDRVTVRVYESVIVAVRPDARPSVAVDTTATANQRETSGRTEVLQQLKAAVTVEAVDRQANAIRYQTGDNRRVIRTVADPRLLEGLKPGDVIEITHSRERAIDLQRTEKGRY